MKRLLCIALVVIAFIMSGSMALAQNGMSGEDRADEGIIREVVESWFDDQSRELYQKMKVELVSGGDAGKLVTVQTYSSVDQVHQYAVGDKVVVHAAMTSDGKTTYYVTDMVRRSALWWLFGLFVLMALAVGSYYGLASILGMVFSFVVIFKLVLPALLAGKDPVITAVMGSFMIVPVTFYLSHGFGKKTHVAIAATIVVLIIVGLLGQLFIQAAYLTGLASEESGYLLVMFGNSLNLRGLLLAGMIIGSMGILDDITVAQASVVQELREANKKLSFTHLYERALRVGRDHVASLVNTLVLVYAGASLPLMLLFLDSQQTVAQVVNFEIVAEEVVRTLVSSIGLILAVPVTTLLAAYVYSYKFRKH